MIALGAPKEKQEEYSIYEVDGCQIHVHRDAVSKYKQLKIQRAKFLFFENLIVEGNIMHQL